MPLLLLPLLCRQCGAEALATLVPRLVQLIKRGVGLNTRAGTANFVVQLTMRHGADMKAHTATLIKAGSLWNWPSMNPVLTVQSVTLCSDDDTRG